MDMPLPDPVVLAKRDRILTRLAEVLPADALISDPAETRAYECDAFTAYRCPPLAAVLPRSTEEVAAVLRVCHDEGVPVVPRGSGTSLAGGALPTADAVILGVARMTAVLEVDYADRFIHVQAGRTNLSVTGAVEAEGFFYAPDPSSQLACAIAGNIGMNSGGAHCLKYGVTTNNLLGVRLVTMAGEVLTIGGPWSDAAGLDLLGVICGSEGQLGIVTEAWLRILPKPELVDEASECLRLLSGRNHRVHTAICLVTPKETFRQRYVETRVRFKRLSEEDIEAYLASGEWRFNSELHCRCPGCPNSSGTSEFLW